MHNSFSPPQSIIPEEKPERGDDDEAFHFIAYVPVAGALYELDGLKPGPIRLADCTEVCAQTAMPRPLGILLTAVHPAPTPSTCAARSPRLPPSHLRSQPGRRRLLSL